MATASTNFPWLQPRGRTVKLAAPLLIPAFDPASPLVLKSLADDSAWTLCRTSSSASVDLFANRLPGDPRDLPADYPGLFDELSSYVRLDDPPCWAEIRSRVPGEFQVYDYFTSNSDPLWTLEEDGFREQLARIHSHLTSGLHDYRKCRVFIPPDAAGNSIEFPHQDEIPALLRTICRFIRRHAKSAPSLTALVAFAGLIHAHPFVEGNGRTARTIYNLILSQTTKRNHFLPIHMTATLVHASYLVKLRRALYGGDWMPLQAFFSDAARLSNRLQSAAAEPMAQSENHRFVDKAKS